MERVKWNVNRDSPEDKLRDFLKWMKAVKKETEHKVCICVWMCGSVKVRLTIDLPCLLLQRRLQKNWLSHCLISFS